MQTIAKEFPYPTPNEVFEEEISSPLLTMALGDRYKELSYHRTGVPELTEGDRALIGECLAALETKVRADPADGPVIPEVRARRRSALRAEAAPALYWVQERR